MNEYMRIMVENPKRPGGWEFGYFVGLYSADDNGGGPLAMVAIDGFGLYLKAYHPSMVRVADPELEKLSQP